MIFSLTGQVPKLDSNGDGILSPPCIYEWRNFNRWLLACLLQVRIFNSVKNSFCWAFIVHTYNHVC